MKTKAKNTDLELKQDTQPCPDDIYGAYETSKIIHSTDDETEVTERKHYITGKYTCDGKPISQDKPAAGTCSICNLPVSSEPGNFGYCCHTHCQAPLGRRHMRFYRDKIYCPEHYPNFIIWIYDFFLERVQPK